MRDISSRSLCTWSSKRVEHLAQQEHRPRRPVATYSASASGTPTPRTSLRAPTTSTRHNHPDRRRDRRVLPQAPVAVEQRPDAHRREHQRDRRARERVLRPDDAVRSTTATKARRHRHVGGGVDEERRPPRRDLRRMTLTARSTAPHRAGQHLQTPRGDEVDHRLHVEDPRLPRRRRPSSPAAALSTCRAEAQHRSNTTDVHQVDEAPTPEIGSTMWAAR